MTHPVYTKLDDTNYLAWVCQFTPILRTNGLLGIVDGSEPAPPKLIADPSQPEKMDPNPAYEIWEKKDQFILS